MAGQPETRHHGDVVLEQKQNMCTHEAYGSIMENLIGGSNLCFTALAALCVMTLLPENWAQWRILCRRTVEGGGGRWGGGKWGGVGEEGGGHGEG